MPIPEKTAPDNGTVWIAWRMAALVAFRADDGDVDAPPEVLSTAPAEPEGS